jgi:branched-chain amino acid transport system substrate-binding protein
MNTMSTTRMSALAAAAALMFCVPLTATAQSQGVSANEIVLGTVQDLSGPIAGWGKSLRNGLQMRIDEANEAGGVRGRRIRLIAEDHGYDPKRAVLATQKLVSDDKVFAIVNHLGTAAAIASMPVTLEKNVISFLPMSGHRAMFEPQDRLKFSIFTPVYDQIRAPLPAFLREKGAKRPCILYQDDEAGLEVLRGTEAGLKGTGLSLIERTSYKRGATDFSSQVARMAGAQCDLVVLGTVIRETIGTVAEARKIGFAPVFVGTTPIIHPSVPALGGAAAEGLYAISFGGHPYPDDENKALAAWAKRYKTKFGEDPNAGSMLAYRSMEIFVRAADRAGTGLSTDSFIAAMDSLRVPPDDLGNPEFHVTAGNRLGVNEVRLYQITGGRWRAVSGWTAVRPE